MSGENEERSQAIEIYRSDNGGIELKVGLEGDTVWLSQSQMALLFGVDRTVIVRHIGNIYKSEELSMEATCAKMHKFEWRDAGPSGEPCRSTTWT